ncbi:MAG: hypothetical protein ACK4RS_05865 [Thiothrix sp.]
MAQQHCTLDEKALTQMSQEIAEVLKKHLPDAQMSDINTQYIRTDAVNRVQIVALNQNRQEIFALSAELNCPPPPGTLNLKYKTAS